MTRTFNTAGPCDPRAHYMLSPERRIPSVRQLIEDWSYFVLHAARQSGKTTSIRALAQTLTAEGKFAALAFTCEEAQAVGRDVDRGMPVILSALRDAAQLHLPEELRPPEADPEGPAESRLRALLRRWSTACPRPLVLFFDEIDALYDEVLISVLRQLRGGYPERPQGFPQSVALVGLRDVRDYKIRIRPDRSTLGTASPFNIKVESVTLSNFTAEEVSDLLGQHTADTGQAFTAEALELVHVLTGGQPWLVNALARQAVLRRPPEGGEAIDARTVEDCKEILIQRRDTHLDSLVDRLREPRVRRVIEPILAGAVLPADSLADDAAFCRDLGLVTFGPAGVAIANPIYREVIPRALTYVMEVTLPLPRASYAMDGGGLDLELLLSDFRAFWLEHAEHFLKMAPYSEAAAQLVFLAFVHKIVNGGGFVDREYAVGSGRVDLCIRWPLPDGSWQRHAFELKVWRDGRPDPTERGLEQLSAYLERLGLGEGLLLVFDDRSDAPPLPERGGEERVEHAGRRIRVLRF